MNPKDHPKAVTISGTWSGAIPPVKIAAESSKKTREIHEALEKSMEWAQTVEYPMFFSFSSHKSDDCADMQKNC